MNNPSFQPGTRMCRAQQPKSTLISQSPLDPILILANAKINSAPSPKPYAHMTFDYKKEQKEFYSAAKMPAFVTVPQMNYVAVRGCGDPNTERGAYQQALGLLYAISFTIKMSERTTEKIPGYFPYVVPPLEGFWWSDNDDNYTDKSAFQWISLIRLPEFVTEDVFEKTKAAVAAKKGIDCSKAEFLPVNEGLCVQILHKGPFDRIPESLSRIHEFITENGHAEDITNTRHHHEIYLSDVRRAAPENWKTVVRIPVKKA